MLLAAILGVALLAAPATSAGQAAPTLVVRARGVDEGALADALRPRSGGADVVLLRDAVAVAPDHTFVDVDVTASELAITVILGDGRVFVRRASAPEGPRDAARLVAAMLAAIAGEALEPLPERGHSPALAPTGPSEPAPTDLPEPPRDPASPELAGPAPTAPGLPDPKDISAPPPAPAREPAAPAPRPFEHVPRDTSKPPSRPVPRTSPLELRLTLDGAAVLGLGVPTAGGLAGGAGLGLQLLGARRWLVAASLRATAGERDNFGLVRLRVGLTAGTWLRRGRFELRVTGGFGVEPWLVTHTGRRVRLGDATSPAPLLGGHLRVTPSFALPGPFRLGLYAELAASAAPSGHAVRISLDDRPLFTLGGLEASLGLELALHLAGRR